MKNDLTELVFILDKSGSMSGLESDTIGGFNSMLAKQKDEEGEAIVTTVLFDNEYQLLHDRIDLKAVAPITGRDYFVGGNTALLDAIGRTINKIGQAHKHTQEDHRPAKTLLVIITDGHENASCEFSFAKIQAMVEHQKKTYEWEFIFLGANIDAMAAAARFGIDKSRAANYHADSQGIRNHFRSINNTAAYFRKARHIKEDWKADIDNDFNQRSK
ncbi:MAG: VWA domain-containing protein [Candidatus Adiutrix sp.]|jgi:uncharacterized protein YegL|nr:VWA domain-containing protein [Candidatus Adiutrix sp.]